MQKYYHKGAFFQEAPDDKFGSVARPHVQFFACFPPRCRAALSEGAPTRNRNNALRSAPHLCVHARRARSTSTSATSQRRRATTSSTSRSFPRRCSCARASSGARGGRSGRTSRTRTPPGPAGRRTTSILWIRSSGRNVRRALSGVSGRTDPTAAPPATVSERRRLSPRWRPLFCPCPADS